MLRQAAQNAQQPQNRGFSCWTMVMIFFGVQIMHGIISMFTKPPPPPPDRQYKGPSPFIFNAIAPKTNLDVMIKVFNSSNIIFESRQLMEYSLDSPQVDLEFSLDNISSLSENISIAAYISAHNPLDPDERINLRQIANLTSYKKMKAKTRSLYDPEMLIDSNTSQYATMLPTDFNVLIVYSDQQFTQSNLPVMLDYKLHRTADGKTSYKPPIDMNQIHISRKHYHLLDDPETNNTVKLHIFMYSEYRYLLFANFGRKLKYGSEDSPVQMLMDEIATPEAMDDVKEILFENSPWLVALTMILSQLESIFQFLAIKNQIQFWKEIDKHQGLSLKVLYTNLIFSVIGTLYLIDNDATRLIIIFQFVNILVCLWKLYKTTKITFTNSFPFIKLGHYQWYNKKTQQYDNQAIHYLYYILVPLFVCYLVYSFLYSTYSGWYSFILQTIMGFISIFGFIQMTPQLYINYKLKSVAHLPWRMLIYRFLTTIIDDMFAFLVTMPWLRRLSCFRDDIIFVIYLYQRRIYQTDYNRIENPSNPNLVVRRNQVEREKTQ